MEQYINKSALVAEIERRIKERDFQMKSGCWVSSTYMYEDLLDFIDTLEVKEVDLDAEFDKYCETLYLIDLENEPYAELFECAKHFFELGLKVQKGE